MREFHGTKFKDYIDKEEIKGILTIVMDVYVNGADKTEGGKYTDSLPGVNYNPIIAEEVFFNLVHDICVMEIESNEDKQNNFDELYNKGFIRFSMDAISNVLYAYNLYKETITSMHSIDNVMDKYLSTLVYGILEKIPNAEEINKLLKEIPKQINKMDNEKLKEIFQINNATKIK